MNLIKRNYLPDTGDIFINGKNYKDINRESVLSFMGTIEQKENILGDTVKNNIKIVRENSTEEEIEEASKKACIHNTIEKLNEKYETVLGNSGTILSTGQQQRISLARVFLKNPEIIILDEATSGLDNTSESKIMQNIDTQFEGKNLIAVTPVSYTHLTLPTTSRV